MAGIDSSIYFQQQTPDIMGSIDKGMRMGDMLKQRRKESDLQDAYKAGMVTNPDGSVSRDDKLTMKAMLDKGYGQEAWDYQEKIQANQMAKQKQMRDEQAYKMSEAGRLAGAALQNPNAWGQIRAEAIKSGYGTEETLPQQFDAKFLTGIQAKALSASEQMAQQNKQRDFEFNQDKSTKDFGLRERELALRNREMLAKNEKSSGALEGRKALDKDYAKDYNDWTTNSRNAAEKNLSRLKEARLALKSDPTLTGSIRGMMPDFIRNSTNEDAILTRDKVRAAAQGALKATLGSAFTEKEGERIMNQSYNEKLSPEANIDLIDKAIREIEGNMSNADLKASYFQKNGTLNGLDVNGQQVANLPKQNSNGNSSAMVRVQAPNGDVKEIPESMVQAAVKKGGKVITQQAGF